MAGINGSRTAARRRPGIVLLGVELDGDRNASERLDETGELAHAAGYEIAATVRVRRHTADRRALIGTGKLAELRLQVLASKAKAVIVDRALSGSQHLNLATELEVAVVDYTGLVLEIFARRATTAEGKLQVALAQEIYNKSRHKGAWTHLERQRGSTSTAGGPGERQIELDRRMTTRRITQLRRKLAKIARHTMQRSARRQAKVPTVALVGYTNAGKSTLFRRLCGAEVPASARLFETLQTTTRRMHLGDRSHAVISDTVGFIRNLPHDLVDAFRSTLHEAITADLLLIVVDAGDFDAQDKLDTVLETLNRIGATSAIRALVLNKIDKGSCNLGLSDKIPSFKVSALSGLGVDELRRDLAHHLISPSAKPFPSSLTASDRESLKPC